MNIFKMNLKKTKMNIKINFTNSYSEGSFFLTPILAVNSKEKEIIIAFIIFFISIDYSSIIKKSIES